MKLFLQIENVLYEPFPQA